MPIFLALAFFGAMMLAGGAIFGHDHEHEVHFDHDHDHDHSHGGDHDHSDQPSVSIFSMKVMGTFIMTFGCGGAIAYWSGWGWIGSSLTGILAGVVLAGRDNESSANANVSCFMDCLADFPAKSQACFDTRRQPLRQCCRERRCDSARVRRSARRIRRQQVRHDDGREVIGPMQRVGISKPVRHPQQKLRKHESEGRCGGDEAQHIADRHAAKCEQQMHAPEQNGAGQ